jgi:hypothetical protein
MRLTRGLSDFNVGRTLVVNGTWDIPTAKSFTGPARWISDGWELGVILTVSDGVPFTATWGTGDDPALTQNNDDWAFPNRLGGSGCQSLTNPGNVNNYVKTQCFAVPTAPDSAFFTANNCQGGDLTNLQCFNLRGNSGRNILIGPGITNLDFSIFKNNHIRRISENFNVQFRAEVFNILNHPNFAPPTTPDNTDIFRSDGTPTGAAGLLTRTTIPERQIQFAIKFIF